MSDIGHEQTDKELKKLEKKITQEYQKATKEVEKKMNDYLSKFAKKDKEMAKKVKNGEITSQEYAEWRQNQMLTGKRWEQMRDTLAQDLVNADKIAAGMINDTLPDAYALNFNYGTYEVENGAEINTSFTLYDHDTVERLMSKDPKMIPKARIDIPKDQLWNRQKITSAVTQGILQGESIDKIAKRLGKVTDMDRNAAIRNARTYTTAAENGGRIDSYERANKQGIEVNKMWMATLDDRTRYEHRHLDGVSIPNDEAFEIDGYKIDYPGDPDAEPEMIYNCRCTLVADIKGIDYNDERNDSKLGEMTYDEWKHALDKRVAPGGTEEEKTTNTTTEEEKANVEPNTTQIKLGNAEEVMSEGRIENATIYSERMDGETRAKFNEIFEKAEFEESENGSYYNTEDNKIYLEKNDTEGYTVYHEATHWFDENQDYTITDNWGHNVYDYDEEGNYLGKHWEPNPEDTVIREHAGFSDLIYYKWENTYDSHQADASSLASLDLQNLVSVIGTSDTYGYNRSPEDVKKDLDAIKEFMTARGVTVTDYDHISDFISAMTFDANLGSLVSGGHSYDYWVGNGTRRVSEIVAGYNVLKAVGREDLIEIERELAPNLMRMIEEEWSKIW